jgi:transcriptional regulator with XRE-family HTH domain
MSIQVYCQDDLPQANRQPWGRIFGSSIENGRDKKAFSVEEAAGLAGMEPSAWIAVEAGRVPETAEQLHSMACALGFTNARLETLVLLCRGAWEA